MKLGELQDMAAQDLKIDPINLDSESLNVPNLHHKYLRHLTDAKLALHGYTKAYKKLLLQKHEYYTGVMAPEVLKELGWEPFNLKLIRSELDLYLQADSDLQKLEDQISLQKEKIEYLESVVRGINQRQFHIRDAIAWQRFRNGLN